jgi:hypothetical protein
MDTHIQGRVYETNQLGAVPCLRGYEFDLTTPSVFLCTVDADVNRPVLVEIWPTITTAFNAGTTNVITVQTQNQTTILTFPNPTSIGVQSYNTFLFQTQTALTLTYTQSGTEATTGQGILLIRLSGLGRGASLNLDKLT